MIHCGSAARLAQRVVALPSVALAATHASPSVVDATVRRFKARLPTGSTITLLLELDSDADDSDDEITLLDTDDDDDVEEGATLLELLDVELPTLELALPATENLIQFRFVS